MNSVNNSTLVEFNALIWVDKRNAYRPMPATVNAARFTGAHLMGDVNVMVKDGDDASSAIKQTVYRVHIGAIEYLVDSADSVNGDLLRQLKIIK